MPVVAERRDGRGARLEWPVEENEQQDPEFERARETLRRLSREYPHGRLPLWRAVVGRVLLVLSDAALRVGLARLADRLDAAAFRIFMARG